MDLDYIQNMISVINKCLDIIMSNTILQTIFYFALFDVSIKLWKFLVSVDGAINGIDYSNKKKKRYYSRYYN